MGSYGQPNPAGAQPGYPQSPANPYGGYSQAPVYAGGGGPAYPGSLAYVEQNFGKVAGFGQRALAYLIDIGITMLGLIPVVLGIIMLAIAAPSDFTTDQFGNTTTSGDSNPALAAFGGLLIALGVLIAIAISIWNRVFKMGRTGQSVGKKVIGLYLLDDKTGQPVGAGMTFLREIVNGLVNQVVYIGWLWMLWDADKQTLGDKSVHSSVVNVPKR
ncbi:MAG: RDD family protein [Ornithinibacter sp.]